MTITTQGAMQIQKARTYPLANPRLTLQGSAILDHHGNPIKLRGFCFGRFGAQTEQDVIDAYNYGANIIRVSCQWFSDIAADPRAPGVHIDSRVDTDPGHFRVANLTIIDNLINWITSRGMWCILAFNSDCGKDGIPDGFGGPTSLYCDPSQMYPTGNNFLNNPALLATAIQTWQFLANRYKNTPYMAAYEISVENKQPGHNPADVVAMYQQFIGAIQAVDPNTPMIVGAYPNYTLEKAPNGFIPINAPLIYTGDFFQYLNQGSVDANKQSSYERILGLLNLRKKHNVPVFIQQVGCLTGADPDLVYFNRLLNLMTTNDVGFTWWEYLDTITDPDQLGLKYWDVASSSYITKTKYMNAVVASFTAP